MELIGYSIQSATETTTAEKMINIHDLSVLSVTPSIRNPQTNHLISISTQNHHFST